MSNAFDELLNSDLEWRRRYELIRKIGDESERGMTVLVSAELERALELVLCAYLAPGRARADLFSGGSPPLGSFSARINLCRTLHLISEDEFVILHLIRKIRNEFAHNPDVNFSDTKIKSSVLNLLDVGKDFESAASEPGNKKQFELLTVGLIANLETSAVDQAHGRVFEESFNTFYRRGRRLDDKPFESKKAAAAINREH